MLRHRILTKLIKVNFSVGYMVLAVTTGKTINKIWIVNHSVHCQ